MISGVSTHSIQQALQQSIQRIQRQIQSAQTEAQTGTLAEPDLKLGERIFAPVSLQRDVDRLSSILDTNKTASTRLDMSQISLGVILESTQALSVALVAATGGETANGAAAEAARSSISTIVSSLNVTAAGQHIFSGINSDAESIDSGNGIPAGIEMDGAFLGYFGFAKNDPASTAITTADFEAFLQSEIEPMFLGSGWTSIVSRASDEGIQSRITLTEVAVTSVTANQSAIRNAVYAASLAANFLDTPLNASAKNAIIGKAISLSASSQGKLAELQSLTGFAQEKIDGANQRIAAQRDVFSAMADDLTAVDPFTAATRLTSLLTQLETSYALTQKIQSMSILRYLG